MKRALALFGYRLIVGAAAGRREDEGQHAAARLHRPVQRQGPDQLAGPDATSRTAPSSAPKKLAKSRRRPTRKYLPHWTVENGVLTYDGKGQQPPDRQGLRQLRAVRRLEDPAQGRQRHLPARLSPRCRSGIRTPSADNLKEDRGKGSGGLWNNPKNSHGQKPLKKADKPVGEWNTFHIIMKGDKVTVFLNGEKVVDDAPLANYWEKGKPLPAKGPIELQHHGDKLWFKNIYIKELPE